MKILITGDFCQKYRVDEAVRQKRYGEIFGEVKHIIKQADYSIVNFEFPIVLDSTEAKPIPKCGPNLKGTIEAVDAVKYAGFNCCTLANNHILDQGEQCCLDTRNELEKAGIDTVGAGKNLDDASTILYKTIGDETLAIINCCEHEFSIATDTTAGANPLNPIQQFYKIHEARMNANYVLVIVHGGHEHYQLPSPRMQETYRFFIDAGADAVVNHHQHCYSGYEVYNGKPIFYGLGNFCFDHLKHRNTIWNEGYMGLLCLDKHQVTSTLIPYVQCGEHIGVHPNKDKKAFEMRISKLNEVIASPRLLEQHTSDYYSKSSKHVMSSLEPYYNYKILYWLFNHHLLPSIIKKKQILKVQNQAVCESHLDKLRFSLKR